MRIIPEHIANNNSLKEYKYIPHNESVLSDEYVHFVRQPSQYDRALEHFYIGKWEDVTEKDKHEERILRKQKEIEALRVQIIKEQNKNKEIGNE